jgi:DHA2 family methylenomycin A resistance protein-like MFS transporter
LLLLLAYFDGKDISHQEIAMLAEKHWSVEHTLWLRWVGLVGILIGPVLVNLDSVSLNVSLSTYQQVFQLSLLEASWLFHAYNLGFILGLIPAGIWADRFGRKRLFLVGLFLFGVGALCCSFAQASIMLLLGRAIQGGGASLLTAAGLAVVAASSRTSQPQPIVLWGLAASIALAIGPLLGGMLVQWQWQAIFWLDIALVLLAMFCCLFFPEHLRSDETPQKHLDWGGLLLLVVGLGTGIYTLVAEASNWWLWGVAGLALTLFLFASWRRQEKALFDLRMLRDHLFARGSIALFLFSATLMAAFVINGVFLRQQHSVFEASLLLFPLPATAVVISWGISWLPIAQKHAGSVLLAGLSLMALGLGGFALFPSYTPDFLWILGANILVGAGMGTGMSLLNAMALMHIQSARLGEASGLLGLVQQVGYTIGTAVLVWLLEVQGGITQLNSYHLVWLEAAGGVVLAVLILLGAMGSIRPGQHTTQV